MLMHFKGMAEAISLALHEIDVLQESYPGKNAMTMKVTSSKTSLTRK